MASRVRIISKSKVQLSPDELPPPGSTIQLSFFDAKYIDYPIVRFLLTYPNATPSSFSFHSFKSSLALVLPHFHPLGGDLTYLSSSNDVAIVCSNSSGVVVLEAESDIDIQRLIGNSSIDVESLNQLVPNISAVELPLPILTVQFTLLSGGGIAVGVATHHAAMDAWGFWQFIDCWAKVCRDGAISPGHPPALHDRAVITYHNKEEVKKQMLKSSTPNLPKLNGTSNDLGPNQIQATTRIFTIKLSSVELLKQHVIQQANGELVGPPTTFEVLTAHFWITIAHSKGLAREDTTPTILRIPMDCRMLLDPPIHTTFTGNCIRSVYVESTGTILMALDGLSRTCASIRKAIDAARKQPLESTGLNSPMQNFGSFNGLKVALSGSPRLQVYGADFGWGKPSTHIVFESINDDASGTMIEGNVEGTIELQVILKEGMDKFVHAFEGGLVH